ncbi:UNVERIFIED_CONTAM: hypothetical protein NCL1_51725 [Trichonephila clavipes]
MDAVLSLTAGRSLHGMNLKKKNLLGHCDWRNKRSEKPLGWRAGVWTKDSPRGFVNEKVADRAVTNEGKSDNFYWRDL